MTEHIGLIAHLLIGASVVGAGLIFYGVAILFLYGRR